MPVLSTPSQEADVLGAAAVRVDGEVGQDISTHVSDADGAGGAGPLPAP
jgi:hypothetical protein